MQKKPAVLDRAQWEKRPEVWHGEFEGQLFGAGASVMFYTTDEIGRGPDNALESALTDGGLAEALEDEALAHRGGAAVTALPLSVDQEKPTRRVS